ncbi:uncharacterized protein LOC144556532 [Carex rostrata]
MGLRFSFDHSNNNKPFSANQTKVTVTVITPEGSVKEFATPIFASDPLVTAGGENHFLCNSDMLYFNSEVAAVGPDELLQPGQLYFLLPKSMLGCILLSADMAALAVKASSALAPSNPKKRNGKVIRRLQVVGPSFAPQEENEKMNQRINEDTMRASGSRLSVARRPVRRGSTSNRRPRVVRKRLSTIEETG